MNEEIMIGSNKGEPGQKITATVGSTDHAVLRRICDARGVSMSQLVQEQLAEFLYKSIASGYLAKIEAVAKAQKDSIGGSSGKKTKPKPTS